MITWGVVGVPTSAAAHWPGLEHTRTAIDAVYAAGQVPLVLGGDCTLAVALVSAALEAGHDVGLMYVDGGQDLMIPTDHPDEPILDAMGVAHLLDLPGTVDQIAALGPRRPMLEPSRVCFFGYGDEEEDIHGLVPSPRYPASTVARAPLQEAERALAELTRSNEVLIVHFDVDVLDSFLQPGADIPQYGRGLDLDSVMAALEVFLRHPGFRGMTLCEFNPDHGQHDSAQRLVAGLATALG
jgi:arginase